MGCPSEVKLQSNLTFTINVHNPTTGAQSDADGAPSYYVYEDETQTAILTGSMVPLDDPHTMGFYSATLACTAANGFEEAKTYNIYITARVGGVQGTISYGFKVVGIVDVAGTGGSPSEVALCNLALLELGADTITSLIDDSDRARLCNALYRTCRNEQIDMIRPNFAKVRIALARLAAVPASGFDYAYQLPSDCLRAIAIDDEWYNWAIEGRTLVTNKETVILLYLSAITDTTTFTPKFTVSLVSYLAWRMAYAITKTVSIKQLMEKQYESAFAEALSSEGAEGTPVTMSSTILTDRVRL